MLAILDNGSLRTLRVMVVLEDGNHDRISKDGNCDDKVSFKSTSSKYHTINVGSSKTYRVIFERITKAVRNEKLDQIKQSLAAFDSRK